MSFNNRPFRQRFEAMGDEAEGIFELVWPTSWVRTGLNRPPINLTKVPAFLRNQPDYLTHNCLVEVMGCGADQLLKLKADKLDSLFEWDEKFPVRLFIWDKKNKRYGSWPIRIIEAHWSEMEEQQFHDGPYYRAIPLGNLDGWELLEDSEALAL